MLGCVDVLLFLSLPAWSQLDLWMRSFTVWSHILWVFSKVIQYSLIIITPYQSWKAWYISRINHFYGQCLLYLLASREFLPSSSLQASRLRCKRMAACAARLPLHWAHSCYTRERRRWGKTDFGDRPLGRLRAFKRFSRVHNGFSRSLYPLPSQSLYENMKWCCLVGYCIDPSLVCLYVHSVFCSKRPKSVALFPILPNKCHKIWKKNKTGQPTRDVPPILQRQLSTALHALLHACFRTSYQVGSPEIVQRSKSTCHGSRKTLLLV